ncbi:hypothetical protein JTE90_027233 [Oedothorax gibbosus]|uniref:THAP-type domain-containing protein n=1 Tax=Oedothorax gibbosus TaxID=931172 RepID=A0AAV6U2N8_9ARAC|nr:hypothetical protein JTE90_027233 [Oedothorax gibbosus]
MKSTPHKLFFSVPREKEKRDAWCAVMNREPMAISSCAYCCEDHFKLEEDMANYWQHKLANTVSHYKLKPDVMPHKFECQKEKLLTSMPLANKRSKAININKRKRNRKLRCAKHVLSLSSLLLASMATSVDRCHGNPRPSSRDLCILSTTSTLRRRRNRLPHDVRRKNAWLESIGHGNYGYISKHSKVCSKHFTEDSFDRAKFGGTWLKSTAVPTIFDFLGKQENKQVKYGLRSEKKILKCPSFATPEIGTQIYHGDLKCETLVILQKKPSPSATAVQPCVATFEPEVVIKEEPIDTEEDPVPSTSGTDHEFRTDHELITPCTDDSFHSGTTPTLVEAFTVIKTEPVDEDDEPQSNSNGNTNKKASKRKAADVGQSESLSNEDSATKNSNAKDHFDVYGEYIAAKLRKLDWKSCAYVQKAFGDILFDAEMGKFK